MTNVSIDWIALKNGLDLFGLLGDVEQASQVACQVPNRRVARGGVQPGGKAYAGHTRTSKLNYKLQSRTSLMCPHTLSPARPESSYRWLRPSRRWPTTDLSQLSSSVPELRHARRDPLQEE